MSGRAQDGAQAYEGNATPLGNAPAQHSGRALRPGKHEEPRLFVGIISAGAVGIALAEAFFQAGHHVHGVYVHSRRSAVMASERIPNCPQLSLEQTAHAGLVVLAVPDPQLPEVVAQVAEHIQDGQMVMHTSGAYGCEVLQPITDRGALPLALHPAMPFLGEPSDMERLHGCAWGVTADSDSGWAVADLLVEVLGGVPVRIEEDRRAAYHAAMAHAGNHIVTVISEALRTMDHVLGVDQAGEASGAKRQVVPEYAQSALLLRRLVGAAVDNALVHRIGGLTGPVARDDARAILRHVEGMEAIGVGVENVESYARLAERTAQMCNAIEVERVLGERRLRG